MFRTSMVEDPWNGLSRCAKLVPAHYLNRDNRAYGYCAPEVALFIALTSAPKLWEPRARLATEYGYTFPVGQEVVPPIKALEVKLYERTQLLIRARFVSPLNAQGAFDPVPVTASPEGDDTMLLVKVRFWIWLPKGAPRTMNILGEVNSIVTWSIRTSWSGAQVEQKLSWKAIPATTLVSPL